MIYIVIAIVMTSLIWLIYLTNLRSKHNNLHKNIDNEVFVKSDERISVLKEEISNLKSNVLIEKNKSFQEGFDKARSEFSLEVYPYKEEFFDGDDGFIINDIYHEVSVGYKYQLFINGIPVLKPSIIIDNVLIERKKEVDHQKIKTALDIVEKRIIGIAKNTNGILKIGSTINEKVNSKKQTYGNI